MGKKVAQNMLLLYKFSKNKPKLTLTQLAKIRPIWSHCLRGAFAQLEGGPVAKEIARRRGRFSLVTPPSNLETNANVKESMCTYTRAHSHIRARDTHGIWHFLQFYNFQASLNHRAYACSCCCFIVFHFSLFFRKMFIGGLSWQTSPGQ
jgi:hypothetical protein